MSFLNTNYRIETGEYGLAVITATGRCTADEAAAIEGGCSRRYDLVAIPQTSGAVLRAKDGTNPALVSITPTTTGRTYLCVKVDGRCNPLAAVQPFGAPAAISGKAILSFIMRYQEAGSVA